MLAISLGVIVGIVLSILGWFLMRIVSKLFTDELFYQLQKRGIFQKLCHGAVRLASLSHPKDDRNLFIESTLPDIDDCLYNNRSLVAIGKSITTLVHTRFTLFILWLFCSLSIILAAWSTINGFGLSLLGTSLNCFMGIVYLLYIRRFYTQFISKYSRLFGAGHPDDDLVTTFWVIMFVSLYGSMFTNTINEKLFFVGSFGWSLSVIVADYIYKRAATSLESDKTIWMSWYEEWGDNYRGWLIGVKPFFRNIRKR
jgi:hypothetical protein